MHKIYSRKRGAQPDQKSDCETLNLLSLDEERKGGGIGISF